MLELARQVLCFLRLEAHGVLRQRDLGAAGLFVLDRFLTSSVARISLNPTCFRTFRCSGHAPRVVEQRVQPSSHREFLSPERA
jgi:hypothetical protein